MLFRIDLERFLTHMIDHFTRDEIVSMQYAILSRIPNQAKSTNVTKINILFPSTEIQEIYSQYQDKDIIREMYFDELTENQNAIYNIFINNLLKRTNIVILHLEDESDIADLLIEYLVEKFSIQCIDLNKLFIEGRVGPIYIDREEISNKAVDIRRSAVMEQYRALESTSGGRLDLLQKMNRKDKIAKLKEIGIKVTEADYKHLDQMLIEEWVEDN